MEKYENNNEIYIKGSNWNIVEETATTPSPRCLHSTVYLEKFIYIFGGYDSNKRTNDFYKFDTIKIQWSKIVTNDMPPSPRERHNAVAHDHSIFIFGGFDGTNKLNDFYEFNTDNDTWQEVIYSGSGLPPTPRHSSCCIVYGGSMYIFGGNDGQCKSDFFKFNFETNTWFEIKKNINLWPKERYKSSSSLYKNFMIIYGGHDGNEQLEDFWSFDLKSCIWKCLDIKPNLPSLRDSHISFIYNDCFYIYGGKSGGNLIYKGDFFEFNLKNNKWIKYFVNENSSNNVFCHGGVFVDRQEAFYVFGGYNEQSIILNDFKSFKFNEEDSGTTLRTMTFMKNMENFINNKKFSDIILISSDNLKIYGHKIILSRINYFENLFNSDLKESFENEIHFDNVPSKILLKIIKYIYTSACTIEYDEAISIYEAANYFGLDDLKKICEDKIIAFSNIDNACDILVKADQFNSNNLKDRIIKFMVDNFQEVVLSESFSAFIKNSELALEVLRSYALKTNNINKLKTKCHSNSFMN